VASEESPDRLTGNANSASSTSRQKKRKGASAAILTAAEATPAFQQAGELYARRQLVQQGVLLRAFEPLRKVVGLSQDYFRPGSGGLFDDLSQKLADVNPDLITGPKASVAGPALESMRYVLDESELKEMFLALLARASVKSTAGSVLPAYVDVVRQLSADEAVLLQRLLNVGLVTIPAVRILAVSVKKTDAIGDSVYDHLLKFTKDDPPTLDRIAPSWVADWTTPQWIDNWIRLNLVAVRYDRYLAPKESQYAWVAQSPLYLEIAKSISIQSNKGQKADWQPGILQVTAFGRGFADAISGRSEGRYGGKDTTWRQPAT
jgi:hypothetical protein